MAKANPNTARTLLINPPVWTPIYPYLSLPVLAGYLRRHGCPVSLYDASLDFFVGHLLEPGRLREMAAALDPANRPDRIDADIGVLGRTLEDFRDPASFFTPGKIIAGQQRLRRLLALASRAHAPVGLGFNFLRHPEIRSFEEALELGEASSNPFAAFCRERLYKKIAAEGPSIVGISLSTPHQLLPALTLGRWIKRSEPDIHVVLGGKQLSALHSKLASEPRFFGEFFDSLVPGQGEGPLVGLVRAFTARSGPDAVPGVTFLQKGAVRSNPPAEPIGLASLPPPDFDGLELDRYLVPRPFLPLRFSEGCYWGKCTFCPRYQEGTYDLLPVRAALDHLERLVQRYGARDLAVNDDCLPPRYVEAFCGGILERGLDVSLQLFAKPLAGYTRKRLEIMARSGIREIRWGVESANPRILALMNKGTDVHTTERVLEDAAELGIWNHACLILGFPGETREEAEQTLSWVREHRQLVHSYFVFEFHLSDESHIYRNPREFSIRQIDREESFLTSVVRFAAAAGMDRREAREAVREARRLLREEVYRHPFWFYLRDREYLQLYLDRFGLERIGRWRVDPEDFSVLDTEG